MIFLIVDNPRGCDSIWFLGNSFIRDTYGKFFQMSEDLQSAYEDQL